VLLEARQLTKHYHVHGARRSRRGSRLAVHAVEQVSPWASQVGAVIYAWLPGQAVGEALADVLLGHAEPAGRCGCSAPSPA
jgi:hypothetical protein